MYLPDWVRDKKVFVKVGNPNNFSPFMAVGQLIIKLKDTIVMKITKDKITEIFCIIDEFCQEYDKEIARMSICEPDGRKHRNR